MKHYQLNTYKRFAVTIILLLFTKWIYAKESPEICQIPTTTDKAQLAAKLACEEHALWGKPFINSAGHLIQLGPMEAEKDQLSNGEAAWKRVVRYWAVGVGIDSLYHTDDIGVEVSDQMRERFIRTRLIDNPWSGAFISYLMKSAGMNDSEFALNDGHIRYIKPAFGETLNLAKGEARKYAYTTHNPLQTRAAIGDLICYAREGRDVYGVQSFQDWLTVHYEDGVSLKTHCDIVVGIHKNSLYSIGGNVAQSVTMRQLSLTAKGFLSPRHLLPKTDVQKPWLLNVLSDTTEAMPACDSFSGRGCDMNRKDWVVLLKAK